MRMNYSEISTSSGFIDTLKLCNLLNQTKSDSKKNEIMVEAMRGSQEVMITRYEAEDKLATKDEIQKLKISTKDEIQKLKISTKDEIQKLKISTKDEIQRLEIFTKDEIQKLEISTKDSMKKLEVSLIKWVISIITLQTGVILTVIRLFSN